jgi:hypothetical protein
MDDPKFKLKLDVSQIETKNDTHPEVKYESQVEGASDIKPSVAYKAEPEIKTKSQLLPLLQEPGVATNHSDYVHLPAPQPAAVSFSHSVVIIRMLTCYTKSQSRKLPTCASLRRKLKLVMVSVS